MRGDRGDTISRRRTMGLMLGAACLPVMRAAEDAPIRLAISESVVGDVNLNDARAAMQVWIKRMAQDLNVIISPKLFETTEEILVRTRTGQLEAADRARNRPGGRRG